MSYTSLHLKALVIIKEIMRQSKFLYPTCKPYHEEYLQVSARHKIWYGQYGNPRGVPVIVLHGGPGFGCSDDDTRFFDPVFWRIILCDQRGANRSEPFADMQENTTQDLIVDLEVLRKKLNIDKWLLFGGSWGSTLAIAYGESYPHNVLGFILRGIFLAREHETRNVWYGMRNTFPEAWQKFNDFIPLSQQHDLIRAYYQLVMDDYLEIALPAAQSFMRYDFICSRLNLSTRKLKQLLSNDKLILGIARTFIHYSINNFFLKKNQLVDNITAINKLPLIIVHGRYDLITLPKSAFELHQLWPGSELVFVNAAGHSALEKPITRSLIKATERMKPKLSIRVC